jgi:archaellum component FlaC
MISKLQNDIENLDREFKNAQKKNENLSKELNLLQDKYSEKIEQYHKVDFFNIRVKINLFYQNSSSKMK